MSKLSSQQGAGTAAAAAPPEPTTPQEWNAHPFHPTTTELAEAPPSNSRIGATEPIASARAATTPTSGNAESGGRGGANDTLPAVVAATVIPQEILTLPDSLTGWSRQAAQICLSALRRQQDLINQRNAARTNSGNNSETEATAQIELVWPGGYDGSCLGQVVVDPDGRYASTGGGAEQHQESYSVSMMIEDQRRRLIRKRCLVGTLIGSVLLHILFTVMVVLVLDNCAAPPPSMMMMTRSNGTSGMSGSPHPAAAASSSGSSTFSAPQNFGAWSLIQQPGYDALAANSQRNTYTTTLPWDDTRTTVTGIAQSAWFTSSPNADRFIHLCFLLQCVFTIQAILFLEVPFYANAGCLSARSTLWDLTVVFNSGTTVLWWIATITISFIFSGVPIRVIWWIHAVLSMVTCVSMFLVQHYVLSRRLPTSVLKVICDGQVVDSVEITEMTSS